MFKVDFAERAGESCIEPKVEKYFAIKLESNPEHGNAVEGESGVTGNDSERLRGVLGVSGVAGVAGVTEVAGVVDLAGVTGITGIERLSEELRGSLDFIGSGRVIVLEEPLFCDGCSTW